MRGGGGEAGGPGEGTRYIVIEESKGTFCGGIYCILNILK